MLLWSMRELVYLLSLKNKGSKRRSSDLNQRSFLKDTCALAQVSWFYSLICVFFFKTYDRIINWDLLLI